MSDQLKQHIQNYKIDYLSTSEGQNHLAVAERESAEVKEIFDSIWKKYQSGKEITEDVLNKLLPHADTQFHRENDYRISTWPCITKDVRKWFEGAKWKTADEWPETARLILEAIHGIINDDVIPWKTFLNSSYRRGFGTGFISPILFCLDQKFPIINSKVVKTYRYCMTQLGEPDEINASLADYLANGPKVLDLYKRLEPYGIGSIIEADVLCHYMVTKKYGGGDLTQLNRKSKKIDAAAWLFVANPKIFEWETAFAENGVEWTGSKGSYAQKLIREEMKANDRVFGYQAGPVYEVTCELKVRSAPYKTSEGTWAVELSPVQQFSAPVALSKLKSHPLLSQIKFIQQTQMSISGLSKEQCSVLEQLLANKPIQPEEKTIVENFKSAVDELCDELEQAQHDTKNPDRFEAAIAEAFAFLGFETEHIGGPGKADVLISALLGGDSYSVVADAKTCQKGKTLSSPNYQPVNDHKEQNSADFAVFIAPGYSGGNTREHAAKQGVGLIETSTLIQILRWHDHIPFTLYDLKKIFSGIGYNENLSDEIGRTHILQDEFMQLAMETIQLIDEMQRNSETSTPLSLQAVEILFRFQAQRSGAKNYETKDIDSVLELLSNPLLGILKKEEGGFALTMPVKSAAGRISVLGQIISIE